MPTALSLHGDYGISGVSTWGARMATRTRDADSTWHLGVIGLPRGDEKRWADAHGAPVERVHAINHGNTALGNACDAIAADVIVPNDAMLDDGPLPRRAIAVCHGADIGWRTRIERLAGACGGLVAVAPHVLAAMRDAFRADAQAWVQPCGIDILSDVPLAIPDGKPLRLAWIGRFDRTEKRVQDVIALAEALETRGADAVLHVVGDGPARGDVVAAAERLGPRLTVGRPCPPACIRSLLTASHGVVMTSATEGWPTIAMEGMAIGRPVFATAGCGGAADAIARADAGVVVDVGDMHAMAGHIAALAADRRNLTAMGERAIRLVRAECDADDMVERWAKIVGAVLLAPDSGSRSRGSVSARLPTPYERLIAVAVARSGGHRVAIYGAGAHTDRFARAIGQNDAVMCVVDDRPSRDEIGSTPVVTPEGAMQMGIDAVVCSSDAWEDRLAERAAAWAPGLPVVRLYERGTGWRALRDAFAL